ncbi:MAG: Uma2 family endonuclease [Acidobacteria bacterium]|nr:Uma2 family endonuclease [Acidobacteriota bacterium]
MTELARKTLSREGRSADRQSREEEETDFGGILLERWVERPDGQMEQLLVPLTPEDYLNPRFGDKWLQGRPHSEVTPDLADRLRRWFKPRREVLVLNDVRHKLGPGLPNPSPDVSVIVGARNPALDLRTYDVVKQGVAPALIIEVISPIDARIRRVDEEDKVRHYQRAGVREYLLVRIPRPFPGPFEIFGYRLDAARTYQPLVPDEAGRLLCEALGLWFSLSPERDRLVIEDAATGELLRSSQQEEEERKRAEDEIVRLRAELERLRKA